MKQSKNILRRCCGGATIIMAVLVGFLFIHAIIFYCLIFLGWKLIRKIEKGNNNGNCTEDNKLFLNEDRIDDSSVSQIKKDDVKNPVKRAIILAVKIIAIAIAAILLLQLEFVRWIIVSVLVVVFLKWRDKAIKSGKWTDSNWELSDAWMWSTNDPLSYSVLCENDESNTSYKSKSSIKRKQKQKKIKPKKMIKTS